MPTPSSSAIPVRRAATLAALLAAFGCASAPASQPGSAGPGGVAPDAQASGIAAPQRPLAQLVNRQVAVFPVQRIARLPGATWSPADPLTYLRSLGDELAFALEGRGLRTGWTPPPAVLRIASRNPGMSLNPEGLAFPAGVALRPGDDLREPAGSQIRAVAGFADARFAVIPLELLLGESDGMPRAMLRLALVDVRLARVLWVGETAAAVVPPSIVDPGPALAARLAELFTDLIVAPPQS